MAEVTGSDGHPMIRLRGVRVHNLRGIDVAIPVGRLTVVTGVSGAGKSSLVFDTLHAEAQRRYLQSFSTSVRQYLERLERPDADWIGDLPPAIAVGHGRLAFGPRSTVGTLADVTDYLRRLWSRAGTLHCVRCRRPVVAQGPEKALAHLAALPEGTRLSLGFPSAPEAGDVALWIKGLREEGFVRLLLDGEVVHIDENRVSTAAADAAVLVDRVEIGRTPAQRMRESVELAFARGGGRMVVVGEKTARLGEARAEPVTFDLRLRCAGCDVAYAPLEPALFDANHPRGACPSCQGTGQDKHAAPCPSCSGTGLNEEALGVFLGSWSVREFLTAAIDDVGAYLRGEAAADEGEAAQIEQMAHGNQLLRAEALARLAALQRVQLGYLTLARRADSLSSGELKRAQLAAALATNLALALYLFEEPASGLHASQRPALVEELKRLRDAGNTVVIIEHDPNVILAADHVIDLGPGAGEEGGRLVYQGPPTGLPESGGPTGDAVSAALELTRDAASANGRRRRAPTHGVITLKGARTHNLQDLTIDFPLGVFCAVTGVSGAGKSSLVEHTLHPAICNVKKKKGASDAAARYDQVLGAGQIEDVILMDQAPLPRSARSNPATYLKVFDDIRGLFAQTTDAKIRNLGPGAFSFNQPGGRCEACAGQGVLSVDMQFLADVSVTCPECHGARFSREVLKIKLRNLSIAEVLDLTVREAFRFFRAQPAIEKRLKHLLDVGLDYLKLGQPTQTLSGGECQRLKLAGHLASSRKGRSLFILLEPTAGLHTAEVTRLLDCLDGLAATGRSLIVVEHNLGVIRNADHVIDLGPGAGPAGGRIVAQGTPEEVARVAASGTGQLLASRA